jgi:hypothetical protein
MTDTIAAVLLLALSSGSFSVAEWQRLHAWGRWVLWWLGVVAGGIGLAYVVYAALYWRAVFAGHG